MEKRIEIKSSKVVEARLFSAGVQLRREAVVKAPEGESKWAFVALPEDVDPTSVSVSAEGAEVLSAAYRLDHLVDAATAPQVTELHKKLEAARDALALTNGKIAVLEYEKELLLSNRSLTGAHTGVNTGELKTAAEYLKKQFEQNRLAHLKLAKTHKEQDETVRKLERELNGKLNGALIPSGEVAAEITAAAAGDVKLTLTYYTRKACWSPLYEARGAEGAAVLKLKLKAKIKQETGEKWEGVSLILSTGNPSAAVREPELNPWYLRPRPQNIVRFSKAAPTAMYSMKREMSERGKRTEYEKYEDDDILMEDAMPAAALPPTPSAPLIEYLDAAVDENLSAVEFAMKDPCDLPPDEEKTFEVAAYELPAAYRHFAVPKRDKDVYLLAYSKGWEKLNLLSAPVNVFLGAAFVGATRIEPRRLKEELKISFGRDSGVIVTRTKGADFSGNKIFGNNKKTSVSFTFEVKNTKKRPIELTLLDQLPLSTDKSISVDIVELSGAVHNKDTGELTWTLNLKPADAALKSLKYAVTYPQDTELALE